jgi:polyisoprenoid-binding protein YceI
MTRNARSSWSVTAGKSSAQTRFEGWRRIEPLEETAMATTLATWTIEPVQASVEFSLDYMGLSTYRTGFRALEGSLEVDAAWPAASSVNASIPVASVDVTNDHLMSRLIDPDLTIPGVTRPVVLDTRYFGQAKHPFSGKIAAAFRAETAIDRRDIGVTWNAAMDTGGAYLGERMQISPAIMAIRQDSDESGGRP